MPRQILVLSITVLLLSIATLFNWSNHPYRVAASSAYQPRGLGWKESTAPKVSASVDSRREKDGRIKSNYGKLPLSFEPNRGQTDPKAVFVSRGNGSTLFLTRCHRPTIRHSSSLSGASRGTSHFLTARASTRAIFARAIVVRDAIQDAVDRSSFVAKDPEP